MKKSTRFENI